MTATLTSPPVAVRHSGPSEEPGGAGWTERSLTLLVVVLPLCGVVLAAVWSWGHGIGWFDLSLAAVLYVVTGLGLALGFHRHFTHRSFRARRWLHIALAVTGSMAVEGSLISWVAHHRRHHVFADRPGDPHSPRAEVPGVVGQLRGLGHAHAGWLFSGTRSDPGRWCKDLLADRDVVVVSSLTPLWIALSLAVPFGLGWAVTASPIGGVLTLLWAGGVRIALLHHVTWSVNSLGHTFGKHPYRTSDRSGNIAVLSILSFGDSWHNAHHAFPASARHGVDRGQLDACAGALSVFERLGWVSHIRRPTGPQLAARRR